MVKLNRRQFAAGAAAGAIWPYSVGAGPASAQISFGVGLRPIGDEYLAIVKAARELGLAAPLVDGRVSGADAVPILNSLIENLEQSARSDNRREAAVEALIERANDLLGRMLRGERAPSDSRLDPDARARELGTARRPTLDELRGGYVELFDSATIRNQYSSHVAWYVSKLTDAEARQRYEQVGAVTCVPWFVIGIIHGMEAGFSFRGHLHNGDSLAARTRNIPSNRPVDGSPPFDWVTSAIDAIRYDKLDTPEGSEANWGLAETLYSWERYNGFRSRTIHNINTPYLWSFSNHYEKGKYVRDNVWDGNAVSGQCGAAVMLKVLVERGIVNVPTT